MKRCMGAGTEKELASRSYQRMLRLFGHVERMDEQKVALGNRGITVEAARQYAKDRKEWRAMVLSSFTRPVWLALCSFGPHSLAQVVYHLVRGGMPLHDWVGINCKKGATAEHQGAGVTYIC